MDGERGGKLLPLGLRDCESRQARTIARIKSDAPKSIAGLPVTGPVSRSREPLRMRIL